MKTNLLNLYYYFKFDYKNAGNIYFLPLFILLISVLVLFLDKKDNEQIYNIVIAFQGTYLPVSGWALMYRIKEVYEEGAYEVLIPYYAKNIIFDISRYYALHLIGIVLWIICFSIKYDISIIWPINIVHFLLLSLFFMLFGTVLMVVIKNIEFSLTIFFIYVIIEVATLGEYMPWPHVFLFQNPFWQPTIQVKLIMILLYIILMFVITVVMIRKNERRHSPN